jgi:hypothetical protein
VARYDFSLFPGTKWRLEDVVSKISPKYRENR